MLTRLALLTAVAFAAVAPAASAATELVGIDSDIAGGPVIGGDRLFWMKDSLGVTVKGSGPGLGDRILITRTFSSYSDDETGESTGGSARGFAASRDFALLDTETHSGSAKYSQYDYGGRTDVVPAAGGNATALSECSVHVDGFGGSGGPYQPSPPRARSAVDGSIAAVAGCGSPVVRDLASGQVLRALPELGEQPHIAGAFVASAYPAKIAVYDWQAGQPAYEIPVPAKGTTTFDLQADGTVATTYFAAKPSCATGVLRFHSAANPAGSPSSVTPCAAPVAVDGGSAAIVTAAQAPADGKVIAAIGADGSRTDLAWLGSGALRAAGLDYAGGKVAYVMNECNDGIQRILRSSAPMDRTQTNACVRIRIGGAAIRGGRLRVTGTTTRGFAGKLDVTYDLKVGKRVRTFKGTVRAKDGAFAFSGKLPSWVASKSARRTGEVEVSYAGDKTYELDLDLADVATPRLRTS